MSETRSWGNAVPEALRSWRLFGWLSALAFLAFVERAFLDWRYVYIDVTPDIGTAGITVAVYVLITAAWVWALAGVARRRRRGALGVVVLTAVLLVGLSVGTAAAFCPSPCSTAWPLVEASNWFGLVIGLLVCGAGTILVMSERRGGA